MARVIPADTSSSAPPPRPTPPGQGGKGISHTGPPPHRDEETIRLEAAQQVAIRLRAFSPGTVANHPKTVAGLVKSSLPTAKLMRLGPYLDQAWQSVLAHNAMFSAVHDPSLSPLVTARAINPAEEEAVALEEQRIRTALEQGGLTPEERTAIIGGPSRLGAAPGGVDQRIHEAAVQHVTNMNPAAAIASGFQEPFTKIFQGAGWALDELTPGEGVFDPTTYLDPAIGGLEHGAAVAGRGAIGVPIGAAENVISEIRTGAHDTDWRALLDFWRLDEHDPVTVGVANLMDVDVNDPKFAETATTIDILAGLGEQVALAKVIGHFGEIARIPGVQGGLFKTTTWADHNFLNGGVFRKINTLFEHTTPSVQARAGALLTGGGGRRIPPELADVMARAWEFGDNATAKIASVKEATVAFIEKDPTAVNEALRVVNDQLALDPGSVALKVERANLKAMAEHINSAVPRDQWPRYTDVRGVLQGQEATTRVGKMVRGIYGTRPLESVTDVTNFVDNLRDRFRVFDWESRKSPADAMRQNAQSVSRMMRAAEVPKETIDLRIGEMATGQKHFSQWWKDVTNDVAASAKDWAAPQDVQRIVSTMRDHEMFSNRGNYSHEVIDPRTGATTTTRDPILIKDDGTYPPLRMNERAHGANAPALQDIHDTRAALARAKKAGPVALAKKTWDQVNAGWRGTTLAPRAAPISMAIQMNERVEAFFTNTPMKGLRRAADWVVTKLPLSEEAQASVANRLGFADVHQAREALVADLKAHPEQYGQMLGDWTETGATKRIEAPTTRFKRDFLDGKILESEKETKAVFGDWGWQIEHIATDPQSRMLHTFGPEETARLMLGEDRGPLNPVKMRNQVDIGQIGTDDGTYVYRIDSAQAHGSYVDSGIDPKFSSTGKAYFSDDPFKTFDLSDRVTAQGAGGGDFNIYRVKKKLTTMEQPGEFTSATRIAPEAVEVFTENGWESLPKPGGRVNPEFEAWGQEVLANTKQSSSYEGLSDHDRVVEYLSRIQAEDLAFANKSPEVYELMRNGRTKNLRLADADNELDLIQDELNQAKLTLDEHDVPDSIRRALVDRRTVLFNQAEGLYGDVRRLRVSKNNAAIRDMLMKQAREGEWEMPDRRWTTVAPKGEDAVSTHRGVLATWNRMMYGTVKFFNKDYVRGGFAEAKFTKWFDRYKRTGYTDAEAGRAAAAQAAFESRDWLHDIGNKSSFQRYVRNELPFLHAWERVAYQWAIKIPNYMGAGFTPLGWGIELNMVHGLDALLNQVGFVHTVHYPDGEDRKAVYLPNPLALLNWLPGFEAPSQVDVLDPKTFLIPPSHLLASLPGLSPTVTFALSEAADLTHAETFKWLHDEFTHDGAFQLQFPGSGFATKVWEAVTGDVPPWAIGHSKNYQEYVVGRAHDAALRYAYTDMVKQGHPMPNPADYDSKETYAADRDEWWAQLKANADEYFHGISWTYLAATQSPLTSFKPTTQEEVAFKQFLQDNGITGERTQEDWDLIDEYIGEHPESLAFNVGMYNKNSKWPTSPGYAAFRDAVGRGDIKVINYQDFQGKLALAQEWEYFDHSKEQALDKAGLSNWDRRSASYQLLHHSEYVAATQAAWDNFHDFLDENPQAKKLFDESQTVNEKFSDQLRNLEADRYILEQQGHDVDKMKQKLYNKWAAQTDYGTTKQDHINWYRHVAMNDYYRETGAIFDQIDVLELSKSPGAADKISTLWNELRRINNSYPEIVGPDGAKYPSPEAYRYASKSPEAQATQRQDWASIPPAWLSEYSYETTYGKADGDIKAYFRQEQNVQDYFDEKTADMSHSSTEYDTWVKWRDTFLNQLSKRNGTQAVRKLETAPQIVRFREAGLTPDTKAMNWIVDQSQNIGNIARAKGWSMWGSSEDAQYYRGWLEAWIARIRDPESPQYDAKVDRYFTQQAKATGITFDPALYRYTLFGISGSFELDLDFSKENQMAKAS